MLLIPPSTQKPVAVDVLGRPTCDRVNVTVLGSAVMVVVNVSAMVVVFVERSVSVVTDAVKGS